MGLADKLRRRKPKSQTLYVGFLSKSTYPNGTKVATVAAIQNFGAPSKGIPPRPFFNNLIANQKATWGPALGSLVKQNRETALALLGKYIEGQLRESIIELTAPPLKDRTVEARLSRLKSAKKRPVSNNIRKPLVDTGVMLNSVDSEIE